MKPLEELELTNKVHNETRNALISSVMIFLNTVMQLDMTDKQKLDYILDHIKAYF